MSMHVNELNKRTPPQERIGYIDALKGFAILTVVLGHVTHGYIEAGMYPEHPSIQVLDSMIYSFHMALFMMISGYLFYTAYFDAQGQPKAARMRRQMLNLCIVYVVYDIAYGLFKIVCSHFTNETASFVDILLFPIFPIQHHWYIYVLILYYIFFSQARIYRQGKAVFCLTLAACLLSTFIHIDIFPLQKLLYYTFFFWIGICYRRGTAAWFGSKAVAAVFFVVSAAVFVLTYGTDIPQHVPCVKAMISLGISLGIWYAFEHFPVLGSSRPLACLGQYSLEIYLLHSVFTAGARTVFPDLILNNYVLSIVLNFAVAASIPILFAYGCKKLSVHDLFFKPVALLEKRKKA